MDEPHPDCGQGGRHTERHGRSLVPLLAALALATSALRLAARTLGGLPDRPLILVGPWRSHPAPQPGCPVSGHSKHHNFLSPRAVPAIPNNSQTPRFKTTFPRFSNSVSSWHRHGFPNAIDRVWGPHPAHESSAGYRCHEPKRPMPGSAGGLNVGISCFELLFPLGGVFGIWHLEFGDCDFSRATRRRPSASARGPG
jgi:hypothetical protein